MSPDTISKSISTRPYFLEDVGQLPASLLNLARAHLPADETVQGIFVVPPETYLRGLRWRLNPLQALLFSRRGILHVHEGVKKGQPGGGAWVAAADISRIKLSLILLYGKLEVFTGRGGPVIEVEYNAVVHHLLSPHLHALIRLTWQLNPAHPEPPPADPSFKDFVHTSYSFYNGLVSKALQPGESILGYVYQPEIREPWLKVFQKRVFAQTVVLVTDQQVILLQEDFKYHTHNEWIFTFIPLHQVAGVSRAAFKNYDKISLHFPPATGQEPICLILQGPQSDKWAGLSPLLPGG